MNLLLNEKPKCPDLHLKSCLYNVRSGLRNLFITVILAIMHLGTTAQDASFSSANELKKYSINELMNIEVTVVSRTPQKLADAASAVQVITGEAIRNSGAANIAEALRLVTNLQVAQLNASAWLIGSRGFNSVFANKLLVMIDGRTVYTPLYGGVFWDMQNVLMEDIERIEVLSGPGGTLWGANAVNGIINIITKNAAETKGLYAAVLAGTFIRDNAEIRYGGQLTKKINYRVYGQHFDRNPTVLPDGNKNTDAWRFTQGGFRMDWMTDPATTYSVHANYYFGKVGALAGGSHFNGQNALAKWQRKISGKSDLALQLYYDRYFKASMPGTSDEMNTGDLDFQYRFPIGHRHNVISGLGYRIVKDNFLSSGNFVAILPQRKNLDLVNAFIQDEVTVSEHIKVITGTKVLHNVYTGVEFQPGVRVSVKVKQVNTLWASASRSVRTPGRLDVDYFSPAEPQPSSVVSVRGGPEFKSEKAFAYELGFRLQPNSRSYFSLSAFYNVYKDVYSLETLPLTLTYQVMNGTEGSSLGTEFFGAYQLQPNWRIRGGYTFFDMKLKARRGHVFDPSYLANDVKHQGLIHSMCDLPFNMHLDVIGRYLGRLPLTLTTIPVPDYFTFDTRLAYSVKVLEIAVVGQNLYSKKHTEFNKAGIPRSVYAKITVRL